MIMKKVIFLNYVKGAYLTKDVDDANVRGDNDCQGHNEAQSK